jgi:hypothetical protein
MLALVSTRNSSWVGADFLFCHRIRRGYSVTSHNGEGWVFLNGGFQCSKLVESYQRAVFGVLGVGPHRDLVLKMFVQYPEKLGRFAAGELGQGANRTPGEVPLVEHVAGSQGLENGIT